MEFDTDGNLRKTEEKRIKNVNQHGIHGEDVERLQSHGGH
jgi:hypothetical protein